MTIVCFVIQCVCSVLISAVLPKGWDIDNIRTLSENK